MTNLGPRKQRYLDAVAEAAARLAAADNHLRHAALDALAHGVPVAHIARAAGVNRTTIYRWMEPTP